MQELHGCSKWLDRSGFWPQHFSADQTMTNLHMWTFTCKVYKLGHIYERYIIVLKDNKIFAVFGSTPIFIYQIAIPSMLQAKNMCS